MSSIQTSIIDYQGIVMSDMATIIGRYKGSMEIFAERVREIAEYEDCISTKRKLEMLAESMTNCVYHNEQLWEKRGKREATDIVELERA
jgi:hypothetical protein